MKSSSSVPFLSSIVFSLSMSVTPKPPCSRVEGKSQDNLSQMPHLRGGIRIGADKRNHAFAPGLCPGRWTALLAMSFHPKTTSWWSALSCREGCAASSSSSSLLSSLELRDSTICEPSIRALHGTAPHFYAQRTQLTSDSGCRGQLTSGEKLLLEIDWDRASRLLSGEPSILSHRLHLSISFRKSPPLLNRQLIVDYY